MGLRSAQIRGGTVGGGGIAPNLRVRADSGVEFSQDRAKQAIGQLLEAQTRESGLTGANRADLQQALQSRIAGLGQSRDLAAAQQEADLQKGLQSRVAGLRRQLGGAGAAGSSVGANAISQALGEASAQQARGLGALQQQDIANLGALGQLGGALQGQELGERQFQFNQGASLATLLQQQAQANAQREAGLRAIGEGGLKKASDFEKGLGASLGIGGTIAGAAMGGPAGAAVGGQIGGQAGSIIAS